MDLNNITLSMELLQEIYGHILVDIPKDGQHAVASPSIPQETKLQFLGNNEKKTVVMVSYPASAFLPDSLMDFLIRMLSACKLSIADIALVNVGKCMAGLEDIRKSLKPEHMLLFGITPDIMTLPFTAMEFELYEYEGCSYLQAPSLETLEQDSEESRSHKKQLWSKLQEMFTINR